jgi:Cof subfamily protein (haloacid dehalogenase superfamily)
VSPPFYRLLALDIDGTLLNSAKEVSPRTRAAVDAARAAGVAVVLVTGRRYPAARRVADQLGGPAIPLVLHNGALVVEDGRVLRCLPLDVETARRAVRIGLEEGADPVVHRGRLGEGALVVGRVSPSNTLLAYYLDRSRPDVTVVPALEAALDGETIQVMFGGPLAAMASLRARLAAELGAAGKVERTVYPHLGVAILDVLDASVGKADAVAFVQGRLGIGPDQTLAVGDNWNDQRMLEQAGLGLLMGNADPEMLRLGFPVLPTNDEDGVAVAVERYLLGGRSSASGARAGEVQGGDGAPPC